MIKHRTQNNRLFVIAALCAALLMLAGWAVTQTVHGAETLSYVKVGLRYGSTAQTSVSLMSPTGFQLGNVVSSGVEETMPLPAYTEVTASVENGQVVLKDAYGTLLSTGMGDSGCVMAVDYEGSGLVSFEGKHYRGGMILLANSNGTISVINYLPLEYYVYGVLNNEMGGSNPLEALKAQAVAARSYVAVNSGSHGSNGFDVCSTTHCQVYSGYDGENANTNKAVNETEGLFLYSEGKPVTAFYYKNSGGHTQNSEDVWSSALAYLKGVDDVYSPDYSWTATISFDSLKSKLEAANYSPGEIRSVAVKKRNSAGAVAELEIVGSSDTVVLKKEAVRTVLGGSQVKSTMFDLVGENSSSNSGNSQAAEVGGTGGRVKAGEYLYVLADGGLTAKLQTSSLYASNGRTLQQLAAEGLGIGGKQELTGGLTITTSDPIVLNGKGYGHGVGMPQDSAIEMAKQGKNFREILQFYYKGAEIQ